MPGLIRPLLAAQDAMALYFKISEPQVSSLWMENYAKKVGPFLGRGS